MNDDALYPLCFPVQSIYLAAGEALTYLKQQEQRNSQLGSESRLNFFICMVSIFAVQ